MDGTIPFHPVCMCGVRHAVPTLQVEGTDQGGRGGQGSLLQPLLTHAHACLVGAVCMQRKQPVSRDTGAGRQLSPCVWHLGLRLEGSRWRGSLSLKTWKAAHSCHTRYSQSSDTRKLPEAGAPGPWVCTPEAQHRSTGLGPRCHPVVSRAQSRLSP